MVHYHHGAVMLHKYPVQHAYEVICLSSVAYRRGGIEPGNASHIVYEIPGITYSFVEVILLRIGLGGGGSGPGTEIGTAGTLFAMQHALPRSMPDGILVERHYLPAEEGIRIVMESYLVRKVSVPC